MTLFVTISSNKKYIISDVYPMIIVFILFFSIGRITKSVLKKLKLKNNKRVNLVNPVGGDLQIGFSDESEISDLILECIADDQIYKFVDSKMIKTIYDGVKVKISSESLLILSPNLARFVATKLIKKNQNRLVQIARIIVDSDNRARFLIRIYGTAVIAFIGSLVTTLPYVILLLVTYFDVTANCSYRCEDYFERLPKERPIKIYDEKSRGQLIIASNDDARQVEIYTSSKVPDEVTVNNNEELKATRTYKKVRKRRKKMKIMTFPELKENDPVLQTFPDLEEPEIPQRKCLINEAIRDPIY